MTNTTLKTAHVYGFLFLTNIECKLTMPNVRIIFRGTVYSGVVYKKNLVIVHQTKIYCSVVSVSEITLLLEVCEHG